MLGREPPVTGVFMARPEEADPARIQACERLESADERARRLRLREPGERRARLVATALLRESLSRYAEVDPAAWRFERSATGRPELAPGQCEPPLRFNVSHTRDLVACAVTVGSDVGVDVEWLGRRAYSAALAARTLAPREARALEALPEPERPARFLVYWTLKEAYAKARGAGLRLPLCSIGFDLADGAPIRASFDAGVGDDPGAWCFALERPTPEHVLALAVRGVIPGQMPKVSASQSSPSSLGGAR